MPQAHRTSLPSPPCLPAFSGLNAQTPVFKAIRRSVPGLPVPLRRAGSRRALYLKAPTRSPSPLPPKASPDRRGLPWRRRGRVSAWGASAFRWQNEAGFAGDSSAVRAPSRLSPPAQLLGSNPPPPLGPGRLTGLHGPSRPWEAGRCQQPGSLSCSERRGRGAETCRFILRTHNAAFTHCPACRNWAGRCLVMLAGLWVNASDLAYVVAREEPAPTVLLPDRSLAPGPPGPLRVCARPGAGKCTQIFR